MQISAYETVVVFYILGWLQYYSIWIMVKFYTDH